MASPLGTPCCGVRASFCQSLVPFATLFRGQRLRKNPSKGLFVANSFDGVEAGSFDGRVNAENEADGNGNEEGQQDGGERNDGGLAGQPGNQAGHAEAKGQPHQAADKGDEHGLDEELADDVALASADGAAATTSPAGPPPGCSKRNASSAA